MMGRQKVKEEIKKENYSVSLRRDQIEWIRKHKTFKIHQYFRDKLDEYIKKERELRKSLKWLKNDN